MDITRFLQEGAKAMAADRPDNWTTESALDQLLHMYNYLSDLEIGEISTGSWALQKRYLDGVVEYHLNKKILEFHYYQDENVSDLTDWSRGSKFFTLDLDIPLDNDL